MLHLYDRVTMAHALRLDLEPRLHALLAERIIALTPDLVDFTEYVVIQAGDTEADIVRHIGLSPLVDPMDGIRFGTYGFYPHWDWLADHGGWFEMILTFGSTFAYILLIEDSEGIPADLLALCRHYTLEPRS